MYFSDFDLTIIASSLFAILILGILLGRTSRTQSKGLCVSDVGDAAIRKIAKALWSKDLTSAEFGRLCADVRDQAMDDKAALERLATITSKTQNA